VNIDLATAFVQALGCDPATTPLDLRALHDTDKSVPGHANRGTLHSLWPWIKGYNEHGYGIFMTPAALDGVGRALENVAMIRAHYIDLDAIDAQQQYEAAGRHLPPPSFAVLSSPGKYHVYWPVTHYPSDLERFSGLQRRLRQTYNGDKAVIDAARVMRLPGTLNHKYGVGHLVTCHALPGYGQPLTVDALEASVAHVTVLEGGAGERHELGDPAQAAPSLAWLKRALDLMDPNDLDRGEWIAVTAAIKQAGWTLTDEATLVSMWSNWCARYTRNDIGENIKQWNSLRRTELGWPSLVRRVPSLRAVVAFGEGVSPQPLAPVAGGVPPMPAGQTEPPELDCRGEMLTHLECAQWFKGCVFVGSLGKMLLPNGQLYDSTKFNGSHYAGKKFIITADGKTTDEPWRAATRSTQWAVPKVDHLRFMPDREPGEIVTDVLGRKGVNTYVRPQIEMLQGDVSPFLNHLRLIIPDENDLRILLDWMAHVVRYPGYKIPWAPVIQSAEGIGKGVIKHAMTQAIGLPYVHFPDAQQLGDSGGKFNGWMRNKVFILADEIRVDEKRHLVEVLKPLISEKLIEVQAKGVDQQMEDNPANWGFFTNYKDAVPVSKNGRRYAMFFSPIQTEEMLFALGMNDDYMKRLFSWLEADGHKYISHYLHNYPIGKGAIPMRAPRTTSWAEAVAISRSPIERAIQEAVETGATGFRSGWVSELAAMKHLRDRQVVRGNVPPHAVRAVLEGMGYREIGRQLRPYFQEDVALCGVLYSRAAVADVSTYGTDQGYE
jgi:hypothetical protein